MQQAADASHEIVSPTDQRTPKQRSRRIESLLWASGLVLLCVAWTITFRVIANMSDSAVSSMQFAELQIVKTIADSLSRCAAGDERAGNDAPRNLYQLPQHCLAAISVLDDKRVWVMAVDAIDDEHNVADTSSFNAHLAPRQILTDLRASVGDTPASRVGAQEGRGAYVRDPEVGTEIVAWTTTEIDATQWVVGMSAPHAMILASSGIQEQTLLMVGLMMLSTMIGLILITVTAASIRRQHDAEQLLTAANAELESRVAERTAELVTTNAEMRQEIERRLHVEQALHASEERSRSLLNAIPDLMFVVDRDGNYLEVRGNPESTYYRMARNVVRSNISVHGPIAEDLPLLQAAIASALASSATQEVTYRTDDAEAGFNVWTARLAPINPREVLMLARNITAYSRALEMIEHVNEEVLSAYDATLLGWSRMLEVRENEIAGHSQRVAELTVRLARTLGCTDADIVQIRRGALLHDIGKMALPDAILRKAGALTEEERRQVQQHPELAHTWLNGIEFLRPALEIPYCHHERWNGAGYPRGLRGEEIPLAARIFSVVDVWDALLADRPYKARWTRGAAIAYLCEQAGAMFDPHVVEVFVRMVGEEAT